MIESTRPRLGRQKQDQDWLCDSIGHDFVICSSLYNIRLLSLHFYRIGWMKEYFLNRRLTDSKFLLVDIEKVIFEFF